MSNRVFNQHRDNMKTYVSQSQHLDKQNNAIHLQANNGKTILADERDQVQIQQPHEKLLTQAVKQKLPADQILSQYWNNKIS
jgi:hypothetical protein